MSSPCQDSEWAAYGCGPETSLQVNKSFLWKGFGQCWSEAPEPQQRVLTPTGVFIHSNLQSGHKSEMRISQGL
jgi:hypothetical protein